MDSGTYVVLLATPSYQVLNVSLSSNMCYPRMPKPPIMVNKVGQMPCFNISGTRVHQLQFANLIFHFRGGAKLDIPWKNLFVTMDVYLLENESSYLLHGWNEIP